MSDGPADGRGSGGRSTGGRPTDGQPTDGRPGSRPATWRSRIRNDVRDARVLARTELRCRVRDVRGSARKLLSVAFMAFAFGVFFPLVLWGVATGFGRALASGSPPLGTAGVAFGGIAVLGLYVGGASGFNQEAAGAVGPLVRTSISPTAMSLGRLGSESIQATAVGVPTAVALLLEVAVGARGPVAPALLAVASLPVFLAALAVGRLLGDAIRYASEVLRVSLWTKVLVFLAVTVVGYVGSYRFVYAGLDETGGLAGALPPAFLPGAPLQAYAGVAFAPLGADPRPLGGLVAALLLAAVPLGFAAAVRWETHLLLRESPGDEEQTSGSRGVPWPFTATPSARVAWRYLLRTRRDPRMLAHLGPLLFGMLGMGASVFRNPGSLLTVGPPAATIAGATVAGAAYCMNPLGDDRDQLPLLLTSTRSVAVLLRGRVLAGLVLGLLLAVGVGTPLSIASTSVVSTLALAGFAVVLSLAGAGTALGIGAVLPRFERREYMSVERAHPSTIALICYLFGGLFVGGIGVFMVAWSVDAHSLLLPAIAWTVYLAVLALFGGGGYVAAVRKFDRLTLDET